MQEDFADAVLHDATMTDKQKIKWLHNAATDRRARLELVRGMAVQGLFIDGAHHKQWVLEQIIVAADRSWTTLESLRAAGRTWTEGVPP